MLEDENYLSTTISSYIMVRYLLLVAITEDFSFCTSCQSHGIWKYSDRMRLLCFARDQNG